MDSSPNKIPAELLGGRYLLGDVIGRGGMASVYTARDINLGRTVALKLFDPRLADADELRRQDAEIELLASLNHPGLVTLFDAGADDRIPGEPRPFLTMELVDGEDLRTRLRRSPVTLEELAVIGAGVADALAYVHSLGIVHRDIKPANILLAPVTAGDPLRPKLTDFGIARIIDGTRLTATGTMVGTAAYLSPEQARGSVIGPASDIYSLGLVLLECVKREIEYPGNAVESAVARLHRQPAIPEDLGPEWGRLLRAMTAAQPAERPTATAVEAALRGAVASPVSEPARPAGADTQVLPAPPARPPQLPGGGDGAGTLRMMQPLPAGPPAPGRSPGPSRRPGSLRRTSRRTRIAVAIAGVALLGAIGAGAIALSVPEAPAVVVPYPSVTGSLGDHLKELQESVQP